MIQKNDNVKVNSSIKRTKFLGHLGLIAGIFREFEIDKLVDEILPKKRDHNVPHSICILAMVINGLGFTDQRLYLFPDFFQEHFCKKALWQQCNKRRPESIYYWRNP
jgi:transposase